MVKRATRNTLLGLAAAGALTIGISAPAWADHTGGAELTDFGSTARTPATSAGC